jgi:hypothetical protein
MFAPARFDVGPKEVRLVRAVTDLSLHYAAPLGESIVLIPGLGPALEIHDVRGTAANGAGELRALFAVRASLEVALVLSHTLALAVETSALALPATGDLALHEGGVVGREPWFYAGVGIGLRCQP